MDEISAAERARARVRRARSWVLCHLGRHLYALRRNPEVSGAAALYHQCRRCGHEKAAWGRPSAWGPFFGRPERH